MRPSGSVYLAALLSRLARPAPAARQSPCTVTGSDGREHSKLLTGYRGGKSRPPAATTRVSSTGCRRSSSLPRRDTAHVEQIVDQADHVIDLPVHHFVRVAQRAGRSPRQPQDLQRVANRRQRIAQLVGQRGEEFVLAAVGFPQRLARFACVVDIDAASEPGARSRLSSRGGAGLGRCASDTVRRDGASGIRPRRSHRLFGIVPSRAASAPHPRGARHRPSRIPWSAPRSVPCIRTSGRS